MTKKRDISKLLVANRGEIASRVFSTCRRLGISSVAVYSEIDKNGRFVDDADEAISLGPFSDAQDTYLNIEKVIDAARRTNAQAIHPGYGFLSENADFARAVEAAGLIFVGPSPTTIAKLGSKILAKEILTAEAPTVPLIPGMPVDPRLVQSDRDEKEKTKEIEEKFSGLGFPLLLKAAAGGGGRGQRIVNDAAEFSAVLSSLHSEALKLFGSSELLAEKFLPRCHHVEIQIFGDRYGNVVAVGERDCSLQRRHQKVVEESPSPILSASLRQRMEEAAVAVGHVMSYEGAGTVEFLVDSTSEPAQHFYFLEVNTRLQVEHPVTEEVRGLDLVAAQLGVASGETLGSLGLDPPPLPSGHAVEVRLSAEVVHRRFAPSAGQLSRWRPAALPADFSPSVPTDTSPLQTRTARLRWDSGVREGSTVSVFYDPLLAKVIVWAPDRPTALRLLALVLSDSVVLGVQTNRQLLIALLSHPQFVRGTFDTRFIDTHFPPSALEAPPVTPEMLLGVWLWDLEQRLRQRSALRHLPTGWRNNLYRRQWVTWTCEETNQEFRWEYSHGSRKEGEWLIRWSDGREETIQRLPYEPVRVPYEPVPSTANEFVRLQRNGAQHVVWIVKEPTGLYHVQVSGGAAVLLRKQLRLPPPPTQSVARSGYTSPVPGKVLRVLISSPSVSVTAGQPLLVLESMKMEHQVLSEKEGKITVLVKEGDIIEAGKLLVKVEE